MYANACPLIKFVFCSLNEEIVRMGPRVTINEFVQQYHTTTIHVVGYTRRGSQQIIDYFVDIPVNDTTATIHAKVYKTFGTILPMLELL